MKSTITKTASLRPLLSIKADDNGELPSKLEVLQTGMWDAPYHGCFMITPEDLQQYIQNFNADVRPSSSSKGLPIDLDHDTGAAAGWMTGLSALPNDQGGWSLWADVSWTPMGQQKLLDGEYAFFSPEFCPEGYVDPEGEEDACDNVLIGGGLTNRPLFKDLQPVMASDATGKSSGLKSQFNKMFIKAKEDVVPTLDEVRVKDVASLTAEDKAVLAEHKEELSQDEQDKFSDALSNSNEDQNADDNNDDGGDGGDAGAADDDGANSDDQNTNNNEEDASVSAKDKSGMVTISASELKSLKEGAALGVSANEKLVRKEAEDHINSKVYSASEGFKAPADLKDELVTLYVGADDKQKETLDKLFDGAKPIMSSEEMSAQGNDGDFNVGTASAELTKKADEVVAASDNKTTFPDALVQVRRENPELAKMADEGYEAGKPKLSK